MGSTIGQKLGMPLHSQDKSLFVLDPLDDLVVIVGVDDEVFAQCFDRLVVQRVCSDAMALEYCKKLGLWQDCNRLEGQWSFGVVDVNCLQIQKEIAPKIDIDKLHPSTNSKHRQVLIIGFIKQFKL